MSFWSLSDGDSATQNTQKEFDGGGGDMPPIPAKTRLNAMIEEAAWFEPDNEPKFISLRWTCLKPDEYKNRKVFQKIRVYADDSKKADKAKRMLAAIDANCGGKLAKLAGEPDDSDLQMALVNRPMLIDVEVWNMKNRETGEMMTGNWIRAVSGSGQSNKAPPAKPAMKQREPGDESDADDEIPF